MVKILYESDNYDVETCKKITIICKQNETITPYLDDIMNIMLKEYVFDIGIRVAYVENDEYIDQFDTLASLLFKEHSIHDKFINKVLSKMNE